MSARGWIRSISQKGLEDKLFTDIMARTGGTGHIIAVAIKLMVTVNPVLHPKRLFDASRDLQGITTMDVLPMMLVASPKMTVTSVTELIALVKAGPDKLSDACSGSGSPQHMAVDADFVQGLCPGTDQCIGWQCRRDVFPINIA